MKRTNLYKLLFLITFVVAGTYEAFAYSFEVNGIYYGIDSGDSTVYVTYKSTVAGSYSGVVTIPQTVTYNNKTYSVTSIGQHAFSGCTGLTNIDIPNSVTSIDDNAFYGCTGLTSVAIPNSVTSIGRYAFYGCTGLTNVAIPNSVTSIWQYAFSGCSGLTSLKVESGNTVYDSRNNCNAIIETASNTLIAGCKTTIIPNSVTYIGHNAFSGCTGLTNIDIPNSVTFIGESTFRGCTGLTSVAIPNSVTSIGNNAFSGCSNLLNVIIEGPISIVANETFKDCRKLKSVSLPYSVNTIGSRAFYFCEELTDFTCLAKTPPVINEYNSIYPGYYMATLHVPERSVEAYRATDWWSHFINIVGDASDDSNIPNTPVTDKCDTNDDGEVNIADVNRVIDAILSH